MQWLLFLTFFYTLLQKTKTIFCGVYHGTARERLYEVVEGIAERLFRNMNIAAVCTKNKGIGGINVNPCFGIYINGQIVRKLKLHRPCDETGQITTSDVIHELSQHIVNIFFFQRRYIFWWQRSLLPHRSNAFLKETLHKARLTALYAICLQIFRHIAQKSLAIRQYACGISGQSAEKSDYASYAQALFSVP